MKNLASAFGLGTALLVGAQLNAAPFVPQQDTPRAQCQRTARCGHYKASVFTDKVMEP